MITFWYSVVSFMLIAYVTLDGRNFGSGILHRVVARTPEERRQVIAAIGPLWSWHEVWLVGFGGTLVAVFPKLLASAFSGYYLALFLILWCLLLRGVSLEVGGHINDRLWQTFWDGLFALASFLLATLFGTAAGNLVRGVPLDSQGNFSMAFFSNFRPTGNVGLFDWYTVSVAVFSVIILCAHGASYLTLKTEGPVHDRAAEWAKRLWAAVAPAFVAISLESWVVRPDLPARAVSNPFCWIGLWVVAASTITLISGVLARRELRAFLGSTFLIAGLLITGGACIYPIMLHSTIAPENSLTADSVVSSNNAIFLASTWWPLGFALAIVYFVFISRRYAGKVSVRRDNQGFY
jgi:cytochrome bd ubiquinol oxidase subunit II